MEASMAAVYPDVCGAGNDMKVDGNVGIGNTTPAVPLAFGNGTGDKIAIFTGAGGNYYGIGLQSYLMQLYGETSSSDIAFGYGKSGSFTEVMRVKGNGNVGIGCTDAKVKLDVSDDSIRMRGSQSPLAGSSGNAGEIAWDSSYIYVCVAANTWRRAALSSY